jgi:hypothetical protein
MSLECVMANKLPNGYACSICDKVYTSFQLADSCRDAHELLYVPMTKSELNRLVNYLYTGEESLLSEELVKRLQKFARKNVV